MMPLPLKLRPASDRARGKTQHDAQESTANVAVAMADQPTQVSREFCRTGALRGITDLCMVIACIL